MTDTTSPEPEQPFDPDAAERVTAYLDVVERVLPTDPDAALVWDERNKIFRLTRSDLREVLRQRGYAKNEARQLAGSCANWRGRYEELHATVTPIKTSGDLARFFSDIEAERARQLTKWGDQRHPDGTNLENDGWRDHAQSQCQRAAAEGRITWAHILQEEFVEALAEVEPDKLRAELIQVAAVCAAWIGDIDRRDVTTAELQS
jgi:hypothetical protein